MIKIQTCAYVSLETSRVYKYLILIGFVVFDYVTPSI